MIRETASRRKAPVGTARVLAYVRASRARLRVFPDAEFVPVCPDFVVEVKSPADPRPQVIEKCRFWCDHGVLVAWAVFPGRRHGVKLRPTEVPPEVGPDGAAGASPALPDFEMPVAEILEDVAEP